MFKQLIGTAKRLTNTIISNKTNNELVTEIHETFDSAADRLIKEAQEIVGTPISEDCNLMEELGFTQAKGVGENKERKQQIQKQTHKLEALNKLMQFYPQYKFIHQEDVERICNKYSLVFGESDRYKGEIPLKNLQEIANFKKNLNLHDEDKCYIQYNIFGQKSNTIYEMYKYYQESRIHNQPVSIESSFFICAPVKDMELRDRERVQGVYIVKEDPIVLYPVRDNFYIIVSKWGLEGEDKELTNEKMN